MMQNKNKKTNRWQVATDYSHNMNGYAIPKHAIYGTFWEYGQPLKWIVPRFPESDTASYTIMVYVMGQWIPAQFKKFTRLCCHVDSIIYDNFLSGKRTDSGRFAETFQTAAPFGRTHKMSALKTANKLYLQRADNGNSDRYCTIYKDGQAVDYNRRNNILY